MKRVEAETQTTWILAPKPTYRYYFIDTEISSPEGCDIAAFEGDESRCSSHVSCSPRLSQPREAVEYPQEPPTASRSRAQVESASSQPHHVGTPPAGEGGGHEMLTLPEAPRKVPEAPRKVLAADRELPNSVNDPDLEPAADNSRDPPASYNPVAQFCDLMGPLVDDSFLALSHESASG